MLITRRAALASAVAGAAAYALPWLAAHASAWRGYGDAIVIDGCGSPGSSTTDASAPLSDAQVEDVRLSGLTCICVTVGGVGTRPTDEAFTSAVSDISYWESQIDRHPDAFTRVRSVLDIDGARKSGKTGLAYAFQDGVSFETDLSRLEVFHQLGVRVIQPTYNRRNLLGDGCMEPANAGLSLAGVEAVKRMNSLGILVDLSHCGRRTAADAIAASSKPVVFSHTGCAALAVAEKGGVAGIYFMPYLNGGRQATAADVIRHLDHMIDVAGEDHVSIGTDGGVSTEVVDEAYRKKFAENVRARRTAGIAAPGETEQGYLFASDLNGPQRLDTLAGLLAARGYSDSRIAKLLGANLRRVFEETWGP
jgi:membrane dipeptidase